MLQTEHDPAVTEKAFVDLFFLEKYLKVNSNRMHLFFFCLRSVKLRRDHQITIQLQVD